MLDAALSDDVTAERVARAFFMFFLGEFLFPNASSVVASGWLAAFEDLGRVSSFDWGSPALARIYMSLDACSRQKVKSFNGAWQVLEVTLLHVLIYFTKLHSLDISYTYRL
jgi:hypothetical protein